MTKLPVLRPRTRGECQDAPRPCPWVSCRYHLLLDIYASNGGSYDGGRIYRNFAFDDDEESIAAALNSMPATCALDVADQGPRAGEEVGMYLGGLTKVAVCKQELPALRKLRAEWEHPDDPYFSAMARKEEDNG